MRLPEIYQIELTNACNLNCSYCQRVFPTGDRPVGYVDMKLLDLMVKRGDFAGTSFIELHQNGEPLMHPEFGKIVDIVKSQVPFVGMSTNGMLVQKHFEHVLKLDTLTLSLHNDTRLKLFEDVLSRVYDIVKCVIRLQILTNASESVREVFNRWKDKPRIVGDEFELKDFRVKIITNVRGCINPWYSVSVQWDGDVVPCCNCVGKDYVYGNLFESSLEEIWHNEQVERMRRYQLGDKSIDIELCKTCVFPNPHVFHLEILKKAL